MNPFLVLFACLRLLTFSPFVVSGPSMESTLHNGQIFVLDKFAYHFQDPQRGDMVVFSLPEDPNFFYVKRIIGVPGDNLHLLPDGIYLEHGTFGPAMKLDEPYLAKSALGLHQINETFVVPRGKYFVLGDNRQNSKDSRAFVDPFVPEKRIVGKYFSLDSSLPKIPLTITLKNGQEINLKVEVSKTQEQWQRGLMYRYSMPKDAGMLFVFPKPDRLLFWMKNTFIPLDLIFLDAKSKVIKIAKNAQPCAMDPCPVYVAEQGQYVLEINGGLSDQLGIDENATMGF